MSHTPRRRVPSPLLLTAVACLASLSPLAQQPASKTLVVTSRLIYVDVIVRDRSGHAVTGLQQSDITVKEDGHPQPVSFFESSTDASAHKNTSVAALESAAPPRPGETIFSNVASAATPDPSADLILLDLLNTPVTDQLYAVRQLIVFCRKLPPGHRFALFLLTDRLHMLQGLTGSSEQLAAAANRINDKDSQMTHSSAEGM